MQGWSPDFIPRLTEDAVDMSLIDEVVPINGDKALKCAADLATREGIFAGISGGATLAGALDVCERAPDGATVLCMLPDTGERYLSTVLFEDVPADMTAEEIEISQSTPRFRFDAAPPPADDADEEAPAPAAPTVAVPEEAAAFVAEVTSGEREPLVMFALEWCEFCWSVRKLLKSLDLPYRSVDLDSVEYQEDNRGGQIRAALKAITDYDTIPQIFVGGEFIGGCTEFFDAYKEGRVQSLLRSHGVDIDPEPSVDPYTFLPTWLHPR